MSFRDIVRFLFKWKWTIISVFFSVTILVTLLTYLIPQSYEAQATVLIERNRAPVARSDFSPGLEMVEVMTTASEIVRSRVVISESVETLGLHNRPQRSSALRDAIRGFFEKLENWGLVNLPDRKERWIRHLSRSVKADPVVNSNILKIVYRNEDPQLAADVSNALTDKYIEHHIRIYSAEGEAKVFETLMNDASAELETAKAELLAAKLEDTGTAIDDRRKELVERRGELQKLITLERQSTQGLGENHPSVDTANRKIRTLRGQIFRISEELNGIERSSSTVGALQDRINLHEKAFLNYKERYDRAILQDAASKDTLNIRLIEYSSVPSVPTKPRLFLIIVSILAGGVLGLLVGVVREYFDYSISDSADVEKAIGVPVLGSILKF